MNRLTLVKPSMYYKTQIEEFKKEFEIHRENMSGSSALEKYENIEDWIGSLNDNIDETLEKGLVPSSTFIAISKDKGTILGVIDIRHRLNDHLLCVGGHIGYSVRKSERLKGYATEILHRGLEECRKLNINRVLITCDKENTGSAKTIIKNGGILENEVLENGIIKQRYWISIIQD